VNPFRYGCVVGGENFCARPELQRQLRELLRSGQNVVVRGPRRMGKTSLVCETVRSVRGLRLVYVDLFCVRTVGEFCRRVVAAVAKCGNGRSFLERLAGLVKGLRPVFTVDRETGAPTITVDVREARDMTSVEEVMDMLSRMAERLRVCVVLDEFQDIQDMPDADAVVARLRAKIQFMPEIPFVFLGSIRNSMHEIFDSPRSPFFKSAIGFDVDRIDTDDFSTFLMGRFERGERRISRENAGRLIEMADGISGDVQELSETTWLETEPKGEVVVADIERGLRGVFAREQRSFQGMKSRLTTVQLSVLRGIARDSHERLFSGAFLQANGIRNVGSVTKALKLLQKNEYVFEYDGEYRFENPFFRAWLQEENATAYPGGGRVS